MNSLFISWQGQIYSNKTNPLTILCRIFFSRIRVSPCGCKLPGLKWTRKKLDPKSTAREIEAWNGNESGISADCVSLWSVRNRRVGRILLLNHLRLESILNASLETDLQSITASPNTVLCPQMLDKIQGIKRFMTDFNPCVKGAVALCYFLSTCTNLWQHLTDTEHYDDIKCECCDFVLIK